MQTEIITPSKHWAPHIPNELLYEIVSYVDDGDLLNLRRVNSAFQYVTADRFATAFFQDRAYELSPSGMKSLVKITEHPIFAPCIRTVIIAQGGGNRPAKFHELIDQAFQNLAALGNKISIGFRYTKTSKSFEKKYWRASKVICNFLEERMLAAAKRTNLRLETIIGDVETLEGGRPIIHPLKGWHYNFFWSSYWKKVTRLQGFPGFKIRFLTSQSELKASSYLQITECGHRLEGCNFSHQLIEGIADGWFNLREIILHNCDFRLHEFLNIFKTNQPTLVRLSMQDVSLLNSHWTVLFTWVETCSRQSSQLKFCRFGKLWNPQRSLWLDGDDKTIEATKKDQVRTVISNLAAGIREFSLDN